MRRTPAVLVADLLGSALAVLAVRLAVALPRNDTPSRSSSPHGSGNRRYLNTDSILVHWLAVPVTDTFYPGTLYVSPLLAVQQSGDALLVALRRPFPLLVAVAAIWHDYVLTSEMTNTRPPMMLRPIGWQAVPLMMEQTAFFQSYAALATSVLLDLM